MVQRDDGQPRHRVCSPSTAPASAAASPGQVMFGASAWESLDIPAKPSREAFLSWRDSEVERFFRLVRSGERAGNCADSPDGQHQLQMDTTECRYCRGGWVELGYSPPLALQPRMMDAEAQSCSFSGDGFHWVGSSLVCQMCGMSCASLPKFEVDQSIVDLINALAAERARTRERSVLPLRWGA